MFGKKFSSNIRRRKRMITSSVILLVVFLTVGYSVFSTDLSINGTLGVSKYDQTLYGVLEKAAIEGTYAKEYTGEHHDSFTEEPTKKIYHWWANNNTKGTAILNMNNVIFANHCWQMIRTTDTGGVKLVYNGEPENGQCLNTRGNHEGYWKRQLQAMSTSYYYGTSYTYDKTSRSFSLAGTVTTGTIQPGQYTCRKKTSTGTCFPLYLVDTLRGGIDDYYVFPLSEEGYSQFGELQFNQDYNSPAYVGYMYNTVYPYLSKSESYETMLTGGSLDTTYWYAHNAVWGSPTANTYNLNSPYQVSSTADYPNLVGEYTFRKTGQTYTNTAVYYIAAVNGSNMYYIQLSNSGNHTLADFNYTYTYGDSYIDNGDGTYTINNPSIVERKDWYTNYSNVGEGKYVCKNAVNNTCSELWYTTSTSNTYMTYIKVTNYKFSKSFTWDGSKYVLDNDTSISFWNINDSSNKAGINNAHYTCWNDTGECTSIYYIYYIWRTTVYYIKITSGKSVDDAINEMLHDDNVNQTNSAIKTGIDAWYKRYMTGYTSKLEDTIFCNDRSIINLGGWNPDGGSISTYLQFKHYSTNSDLSCPNDTDKFSVSNNKAQLTYPVGLLTYPETYLLNNNNIRKTGKDYWLGSPRRFDDASAGEYEVETSGSISDFDVHEENGLRPAVSLKPGTIYTSGSGSMADPYVVE